MGVFAALALILAAVGIYGVMSYVVAQRTREIDSAGARCDDPAILHLVLGDGVRLIVTGVVLGVAGAVALREVFATELFQVDTLDSSAFFAVALLTGAGLLACAIPAVRATRLQAISRGVSRSHDCSAFEAWLVLVSPDMARTFPTLPTAMLLPVVWIFQQPRSR